jgi:2-iminobutanoate/2-iminopropanoate deaminase
MGARKVNVEGVGRLPTFCSAVVAGDFVYVSGTLGTQPGSFDLVPGGTGPQTTQTLRNIETILAECGARLEQLVKVNVFLADMSSFREMNAAYAEVIGDDPPARITVGRAELALGAAVEIDAVAYTG